MEKTNNRHTVIMNEVIVRLLMSLSHGGMIKQKHKVRGY